MSYMRTDEETVRRLYPKLIEIVEGEDPDSAAFAIVTALTVFCWREGYSLPGLLWLTRGAIENGWHELSKWGRPADVPERVVNGEDKGEENDG